ncbi:PQ loop repeat-domain-containing protein [Peziza echinospora]|nr:PQ loop repeat-domain-containing protein [Peziza echinospora]
MFPPTQNLNIDARAISGIAGSISIACWVIVFSPQIIVNFRRGSADGLSLVFLAVWLLGDVFNVLGAVLQGVLPTMVILAVYYTFADIVLLIQCLYYRRRNNSVADTAAPHGDETDAEDDEEPEHFYGHQDPFLQQHIDGVGPSSVHLSPATPLLNAPKLDDTLLSAGPPTTAGSIWISIILNTTAVTMVCLAGVLGWYLTTPPASATPEPSLPDDAPIQFSPLGQTFGYLCAVLYLFSRLPQIYLNYQRGTVEGLSLLFFLFACLGNLTYVISIVAFVPPGADAQKGWTEEDKTVYWRYIAVNASWLLGSVGTLGLDMIIFAQFFWYRDQAELDYDYRSISDEGSDADIDSDTEAGVGRSAATRSSIVQARSRAA